MNVNEVVSLVEMQVDVIGLGCLFLSLLLVDLVVLFDLPHL